MERNFVRINFSGDVIKDMLYFEKNVTTLEDGTIKEDVSIEPTHIIFDQSNTKDLALQKALIAKLNSI